MWLEHTQEMLAVPPLNPEKACLCPLPMMESWKRVATLEFVSRKVAFLASKKLKRSCTS